MKAIISYLVIFFSLAFFSHASPTEPLNPSGSVNSFALSFLSSQLDDGKSNQLFSPFSIDAALSMVEPGAGGETARQIRTTLQMPDESGIETFRKTFAQQIKENTSKSEGVEISVANRVWANKTVPFQKPFLDQLTTLWNAPVGMADFSKPAEARNNIHDWVKKQTRDKIKSILPPTSPNPGTGMILVNAVYFFGKWNVPFDANNTSDGTFHPTPGKDIQVPFMSDKQTAGYFHEGGLEAIELNYLGDRYSMIILLPEEGKLEAQLKSLAPLQFEEIAKKLRSNRKEVQINIPKWKIESDYGLSEKLQAAGMSLPFTEQADFSAISKDTPIWIGNVFHKAFMEVNEKGTEAAAVTAVEMFAGTAMPDEMPPRFVADRPFLYFLVHRDSRTILFAGILRNPKT